jgi:hypothetical protein
MEKWKIWLGLVVLFLSGVVVGGVGTGLYAKHQISQFFSGQRPVFKRVFVRRLVHGLDLSKDQRQQIDLVGEHAETQFLELRQESRGEVQAILDRAITEMKKHLSPLQRERLDENDERMKRLLRWHPTHPLPTGPGTPPGKSS